MANAMVELFENDSLRHRMRKDSYDFNREATWPKVAQQYINVFEGIKSEQYKRPRPQRVSRNGNKVPGSGKLKLPRFNIDHLSSLTDGTGVLQHATYSVANRNYGYCTDDNARALIASIRAGQLSSIAEADKVRLRTLSSRYLSFLLHAFNPETGRFRNQMTYSRTWQDNTTGSADSHGRALWGLGTTVSRATKSSHVSVASTLFMQALSAAQSFRAPRAMAFSMLGIDAYLKMFSGDSKARRIYASLADNLFAAFEVHAVDDWPWIENTVTYSNGTLSHALISAGKTLQRDALTQMGLKSLEWLMQIQTEEGHLTPIGNKGWYSRGNHKARFDQHPLEIHGLLQACVAAHNISGDDNWLKSAQRCFSWFLGNNDLDLLLHDK